MGEESLILIAKSGIIRILYSRTSILAFRNSKRCRYNVEKSININTLLHSALISRFDLVYILLDSSSFRLDNNIAKHIISSTANFYSFKSYKSSNDNKLKKYIDCFISIIENSYFPIF